MISPYRFGVTIGSQRLREVPSRDEERHLQLLEGVYQVGSGFSRRIHHQCSLLALKPANPSRFLPSFSQHIPPFFHRLLLHSWQYMTINSQRHTDVTVPQYFLDYLDINSHC